MRIEHAFEYNADYYEVSDEFCANDSEYQAKVLNAIGTQFKVWTNDRAKTMTHVQILEVLCNFGLMSRNPATESYYYHLTDAGLKWLGRRINVEIKEDK